MDPSPSSPVRPGSARPAGAEDVPLDPRRLLVFAEVARRGSLAAAAAALGWTQPAVAQHVKRLEREAGCALVVRTSRGTALTEAGRRLAEHATELGRRLQAARDELTALADLRTGRVRLAAFPSACATLLPPVLAALAATAPGVQVRLTEAEPPQARELLEDGEVDLAVTFTHVGAAPQPARPPSTGLFDDPVLLVLPAGHPLAGTSPVSLARTAGEAWIAGCPRCRAHLVATAAGAGFRPDIQHSTDDYVVTQRLVAAGLGVALLPALALEAVRDPHVLAVPLAEDPCRRIALDRSPHLPDGPATAVVAEALERVSRPRR